MNGFSAAPPPQQHWEQIRPPPPLFLSRQWEEAGARTYVPNSSLDPEAILQETDVSVLGERRLPAHILPHPSHQSSSSLLSRWNSLNPVSSNRQPHPEQRPFNGGYMRSNNNSGMNANGAGRGMMPRMTPPLNPMPYSMPSNPNLVVVPAHLIYDQVRQEYVSVDIPYHHDMQRGADQIQQSSYEFESTDYDNTDYRFNHDHADRVERRPSGPRTSFSNYRQGPIKKPNNNVPLSNNRMHQRKESINREKNADNRSKDKEKVAQNPNKSSTTPQKSSQDLLNKSNQDKNLKLNSKSFRPAFGFIPLGEPKKIAERQAKAQNPPQSQKETDSNTAKETSTQSDTEVNLTDDAVEPIKLTEILNNIKKFAASLDACETRINCTKVMNSKGPNKESLKLIKKIKGSKIIASIASFKIPKKSNANKNPSEVPHNLSKPSSSSLEPVVASTSSASNNKLIKRKVVKRRKEAEVLEFIIDDDSNEKVPSPPPPPPPKKNILKDKSSKKSKNSSVDEPEGGFWPIGQRTRSRLQTSEAGPSKKPRYKEASDSSEESSTENMDEPSTSLLTRSSRVEAGEEEEIPDEGSKRGEKRVHEELDEDIEIEAPLSEKEREKARERRLRVIDRIKEGKESRIQKLSISTGKIIGQNDLVINLGLGKIKLESDYIPPEDIKEEPYD